MTWYKTGTVSVTNGQTYVSATGTKFASNCRVGDGFRGPDGGWYEIVNISSDTLLGIYPAYQGMTVNNSSDYIVAPIQGYVKESADRLRVITNKLQAVSEGAVVDSGAWDASSGTYPTKPEYSAFWRVTVGGSATDGGTTTTYAVGDTLVWSKALNIFYKNDNTESVSSVNGRAGDVVVSKADVGLSLVDNTSDANKPLSSATIAALTNKLSLSGGSLSGPLSSSSTGSFTRVTLTSESEPIINGGATHAAVAPNSVLTIAKNDNLISEFISSTGTFSSCSRIRLLRSRGTVTNPTTTMAGDLLGAFQFLGYEGANYVPTSALVSVVDGTPTPGVLPSALQFYTGGATGSFARWQIRATGDYQPSFDNVYDVGAASLRPKVIWAATGAISTSDAREKTPVRVFTDSEIQAAKALAKEIGAYRWLISVAEKGEEAARDHIGMTVQRAIEVMRSYDLDPFEYGFICHDTWDERIQSPVAEGEASVVLPAGDRYSFRIDQLNLFIAAGFEARLADLEKRLEGV